MKSNVNTEKLGSIKTYTLVAWVFSIIINVAEILFFLYFVGALLLFFGGAFYYVGPIVLVYIIVVLVFLIPSIYVMRRAGRLYNAAKRADVRGLKEADSVGWAIVALIFTGVVPGIMLLIAHGSISELEVTSSSRSDLEEDSIGKLERLKTLLDDGILSQDEFEQQKRKILKPMGSQMSTPEEELRRLKQLFDSGVITEAEFEAQKKRILSRL